jgi:aromatic ring-cleaving dioxygenase
MKLKTTRHKAPILEYYGRHITIKSEGTGEYTHVYIDGKEVQCLSRLRLNLAARGIATVELTILDVGEQPLISPNVKTEASA